MANTTSASYSKNQSTQHTYLLSCLRKLLPVRHCIFVSSVDFHTTTTTKKNFQPYNYNTLQKCFHISSLQMRISAAVCKHRKWQNIFLIRAFQDVPRIAVRLQSLLLSLSISLFAILSHKSYHFFYSLDSFFFNSLFLPVLKLVSIFIPFFLSTHQFEVLSNT